MNSNTLYGVNLYDAHNSTIKQNTLGLNDQKGINMLLSHGSLIDENTFSNNELGGMLVNMSNATRIFNNSLINTLVNANALAVYLYDSDNAVLYNNTITTYNLGGLLADSSQSGNLSNNNFYNVNASLTSSDSNTFANNLINNSGTAGLTLTSSDSNTIDSNIVRYATLNGFKLSTSHSNTLTNNTLNNNTGDGLEVTSSTSNVFNNNTIIYNSDNGVELLNATSNNMSYNFVQFNLIGISFDEVGVTACTSNNISYNDLTNNTNYDMENLQSGTAVTAENNYWASTWGPFVDTLIYDSEEASVGAVDFCPLLNATFTEGTSIACRNYSISLSVNQTTLIAQNFRVNATATDDYFANGTYQVLNASNTTMVWANGTFNSTSKSFSSNYDSIFLPVGTWSVIVNCSDTLGNNYSANQTITSAIAIKPVLASSATGSATIGGSDINFEFNVTSKAYPYTKFFMNLTSGANVFNTVYAKVKNSANNETNISGSFDYSGASTYTLPAITSGYLPSYVLYSTGIYRDNLTLVITPYTGLSAGSYSGSYGWGLFTTS